MSVEQVTKISKKLENIIQQSDKNENGKIDDNEMSLFLKNCYDSGCTSEEIISVTGQPVEGSLYENYLKQIQEIEKKEDELGKLNTERQNRVEEIYRNCCQERNQAIAQKRANANKEALKGGIFIGIISFLSVGLNRGASAASDGIKFAQCYKGALARAMLVGLGAGALWFLFDRTVTLSDKGPKIKKDDNDVIVGEDNKSEQDKELQELNSRIKSLDEDIQSRKNAISMLLG